MTSEAAILRGRCRLIRGGGILDEIADIGSGRADPHGRRVIHQQIEIHVGCAGRPRRGGSVDLPGLLAENTGEIVDGLRGVGHRDRASKTGISDGDRRRRDRRQAGKIRLRSENGFRGRLDHGRVTLHQHRRPHGCDRGGVGGGVQLLALAQGQCVVERHAQKKDGRNHHEREDDGDVGLPITPETEHCAAEHDLHPDCRRYGKKLP